MTDEARCPATASPEHVTDSRCNLVRGHRGDCSFGTITAGKVSEESATSKLMFATLGLIVALCTSGVVIGAFLLVIIGLRELIQWGF